MHVVVGRTRAAGYPRHFCKVSLWQSKNLRPMRRRTFLAGTSATLVPRIAWSQDNRVLKFIPQSDAAVLDPICTTAYVTRNHGCMIFMIFDTLFGTDGAFNAGPQMVAGLISDVGRNAILTGKCRWRRPTS
jgi:hypothetical protein